MGWIHYFNHSIGFYTQASWGFLADFGSPANEDTSTTTSSNSKKTFIYNTVPIELGVCINCWKHLHLQCGATYMWKEIPLLTIGVGYAFLMVYYDICGYNCCFAFSGIMGFRNCGV